MSAFLLALATVVSITICAYAFTQNEGIDRWIWAGGAVAFTFFGVGLFFS